MNNEQESTIESVDIEADEKRSGGTNIVALAVRSAFLTFVAAVLAFSCFLVFSPYSAMKIYSNLGNFELALSSAEKYMERHPGEYDADKKILPAPFGKYADALYFATNTSISFMNDAVKGGKYNSREAKYYAEKVYKYTQAYLTANGSIDSLYRRTLKVDEYSLQHTKQRSLHPYVYSYRDDLERAKFKSAYIILGNKEVMRDATVITNTWNNAQGHPWMVRDGKLAWGSEAGQEFSDDEVRQMFLLLSNLANYTRTETDKLYYSGRIVLSDKALAKNYERGGDVRLSRDKFNTVRLYGSGAYDLFIDSSGKFTELYDNVYGRMESLLEYIKANADKYVWGSGASSSEHLKYTYYLKALKDFTLSMVNMTVVLSAGRGAYNAENDIAIQQSEMNYANLYFVNDIWFYRDGSYWNTGADMSEWYLRGPLINYVYFGMSREDIENRLKPKA